MRDRNRSSLPKNERRTPRWWRAGRKWPGLLACAAAALVVGSSPAAAAEGGLVDPFEVVAAFDRAAQVERWRGFDATTFPVAIYDGERTLLLRHPSPPEEFAPLEGHDGVWSSPGKHPAMRWNSNADIGGVQTATLLLTIEPGRAVEYEAHILYHEVFHLYSKPLHPTWRPNEIWRYSYPMDDLDTFRLLLLEEEALARAVEADSDQATAAWAAAALAVRTERQASLREEHRTWETLLELQEGTAVYMGRSTIGIANDTEGLREERGPEGIRWRCYETGAAVAVVLDRLMPSWKKTLDAEPETTFTDLLSEAVAVADVPPAPFSDEDLAHVSARAESALAELAAERAGLVEDFDRRGMKVIVRPADETERLGFENFDPMAVEVLDEGQTLQAHLLVASHPRGEMRLENPHFVRRSLEGVIALTRPAGDHPFLDGFRQIAVAGFQGDPTVERNGDAVKVEAEGLSVVFDRAVVVSTDDALIITVLPFEAGE